MKKNLSILFLITFYSIFPQDITNNQNLDEVVVSSTKLDIPFSRNFRTVKIISSEYIKNSPSTNVLDLLQEVTGIDIRRRGVGLSLIHI